MRRFYVFNNADLVRQHVSQVKTLADLQQLQADIIAADCNLTRFVQSEVRGVYCVDCMAASPTERHVFMTQSAADRLRPTQAEKSRYDSFTVLRED